MGNKKYYTPEISEFHVGFKYEFRHSDYKEKGWIKFSTPVFNIEREDCPFACKNLEEYRVKYLDKEDIESLGFTFIGKTIDNWYELKGIFPKPLSNYKFRCITLRHDFRTHKGVHIIAYEYEGKGGEEMTLYLGECKNKSELISQLKRCGIEIKK